MRETTSVACRAATKGGHGLRCAALRRAEKLATLEFDRERKTMSVICRPATNGSVTRGSKARGSQLLVKGAAECVLQRCTQVRPHTSSAAWVCAHLTEGKDDYRLS